MGFSRRWMLQPMQIVRIILFVNYEKEIIDLMISQITEQAAEQVIDVCNRVKEASNEEEKVKIKKREDEWINSKQGDIQRAQRKAYNRLVRSYPVMKDLKTWQKILDKVAEWERAGGRFGRIRTPWVRIGAVLNAIIPAGVVFALGMALTNAVYSIWITPGVFSSPLWVAALVGLSCVLISSAVIGLFTAKSRATKAEKDAGILANAAITGKSKANLEQLDPVKRNNEDLAKKAANISVMMNSDPPPSKNWLGPMISRKLFLTPRDIVKIIFKINQLQIKYQQQYNKENSKLATSLLSELCEQYPEMRGLNWVEINTLYLRWCTEQNNHGYVRNFQYYVGTVLKIVFTVASSFALGYLATELIYTFVSLGFDVTSIMNTPFIIGLFGGIGFMLLLGILVGAYCTSDSDTETSLDVKLVEMQENVSTVHEYTTLLLKEQKINKINYPHEGNLPLTDDDVNDEELYSSNPFSNVYQLFLDPQENNVNSGDNTNSSLPATTNDVVLM